VFGAIGCWISQHYFYIPVYSGPNSVLGSGPVNPDTFRQVFISKIINQFLFGHPIKVVFKYSRFRTALRYLSPAIKK
jgi:hypothetical protein